MTAGDTVSRRVEVLPLEREAAALQRLLEREDLSGDGAMSDEAGSVLRALVRFYREHHRELYRKHHRAAPTSAGTERRP